MLVKQRAALDEMLQVAPTALSNLFHTYNPATGTLDTRTNVGENLDQPHRRPGAGSSAASCTRPPTRSRGKSCVRPRSSRRSPRPRRRPAAAFGPTRQRAGEQVETVDRTLGGILEVQR